MTAIGRHRSESFQSTEETCFDLRWAPPICDAHRTPWLSCWLSYSTHHAALEVAQSVAAGNNSSRCLQLHQTGLVTGIRAGRC